MADGWAFEIPLVGPGGEPVDLWRTVQSHGLTDLPPMRIDGAARALEATLAVPGLGARTVRIAAGGAGLARVAVVGAKPGAKAAARLGIVVRHALRLDEDLSGFYGMIATDPDLAWAAAGAGRLARGGTVFEEVVKTVCTTNCAWSGTVRMVGALVAHLGEPAPGAPADDPWGRAFPTPAAMAAAEEAFYRDVARCGYRGRYLRDLAAAVAEGRLDLEALGTIDPEELPDDEVERRLLVLPGVGPYAAAHVMMLLGRYSRLVLDSWTRPTYAKLVGAPATDAEIAARFAPYGRWAGLAFWLLLTRDWVAEAG